MFGSSDGVASGTFGDVLTESLVGVSTGHVSMVSHTVSPLSFIAIYFLAVSIWFICGELGNDSRVQLDLLASKMPTMTSSVGDTDMYSSCCCMDGDSLLNDMGLGSGETTSGLHFISPYLLFLR